MKLSFTDGSYAGIIFSYGRVQLIEQGDTLCIKFEYEVYNRPKDLDEAGFKHCIFEHLEELLLLGLIDNSLVYAGGTDQP